MSLVFLPDLALEIFEAVCMFCMWLQHLFCIGCLYLFLFDSKGISFKSVVHNMFTRKRYHKLCYLHFKKLPSTGPFHLISTPPIDEIFRGALKVSASFDRWNISEGMGEMDYLWGVGQCRYFWFFFSRGWWRGMAIREWPNPVLSPEWKHVQSALAFSNGGQSLLVHCGQ